MGTIILIPYFLGKIVSVKKNLKENEIEISNEEEKKHVIPKNMTYNEDGEGVIEGKTIRQLEYEAMQYAASNPQSVKLNNKELLRFLSHSTNEDIRNILCLDYMKDYRKCTDYISGKSSETQGVNSYLGAVIGKMFIGPFAESCCGREFSMREVVYGSRKKVLFIEYDLQRGNVLAPMYGMLIERALAYALGGREKVKKNKYFLLDEALLLPKLEHLQNSTNFGRSQGIKIICGSQNIEGFESLYGEAGAKNMLSSFQNIVAFKVTDYDTRQFLIQRLGENYINHSISAQQQSLNVQREGHTIEDWQLLSLQKGEAVVSLAWEDPFLFKMPLYQRTQK